jgi:hypothetical protein
MAQRRGIGKFANSFRGAVATNYGRVGVEDHYRTAVSAATTTMARIPELRVRADVLAGFARLLALGSYKSRHVRRRTEQASFNE